jgi:threonine aldolase
MSSFAIDLRSDTVTEPTEEMREAMRSALVGDDGYGEDPTVRELEVKFAKLVGKEAALFVPSGTMANQIAVRILTNPGDVILAGARQHVVLYEMGAAARNSGVQFRTLSDIEGAIALNDLEEAIASEGHHQPRSTAIFVENSHMPSGGLVLTDLELRAIDAVGDGRNMHLDGARLFNAAVATGIPVAQLAAPATTVMCCLSKGLSAPVGSLLGGSAALMDSARLERKRLGGAMRQAGVLAAPGCIALDSMIDRLADDHVRARALAHAVAKRWPEVEGQVMNQPTNLVVFDHAEADALVAHFAALGIGIGTIAPGVVRFVTHRGIDDRDVDRVTEAIALAP